MLRDLIRLAFFALAGLVLLMAYASYRIWDEGGRDDARTADAIVVLGAAEYDGLASPVLAARLDHAVSLYFSRVAPILVVTGGKRNGDRTTEAAVARDWAVDHRVPADAILLEPNGRNTLESLRAVAAMLRERGLHRVVFVSDETHMLRVLRIARDEGIEGYGSPTRTSPTDRSAGPRLDATIHELGALAAYFLAGVGPPGPPPATEP